MRGLTRSAGWLTCWVLVLVALTAPDAGAEEPAAPSLESLMATVADTGRGDRERQDAAKAIAEHHFEPDTLVPWLREQLQGADDFHLRLALAYALAAQGEVDGLKVLVDSLSRMGHLGYVFLQRVSEQRIGGPGVGWDKPAWDRWLAGLDADAWRELQRKRHVPRVAEDGDAEGFKKAVAWWDGLALLDPASATFVTYTTGWIEMGDEPRRDTWAYGFLLKEDATSFTILGTDLEETVHPKKPPKGEVAVRFEKRDPVATLKPLVEALRAEKRERPGPADHDAFGVDYYRPPWRFQGFLLARTLAAKGAQDLALEVWKHVAAVPGGGEHGAWSAGALLQGDTAGRMYDLWEQDAAEPKRTWAQALERYKRWQARFAKDGQGAATVALLTKMAAEEAGYEAAAKAADADPAERARKLTLGLPTVRMSDGGPKPPEDARTRLVAMGYAAVPALRKALEDERYTKALLVEHGWKGWMRTWSTLQRVRDIALGALEEITQQQFRKLRGVPSDWDHVVKAVDAWWGAFQAEGEEGVLKKGVSAGGAGSVAQAKRLVERFPAGAFASVRGAIEAAEGERLAAALVATLAPLATDEVRAFLLERAKEGPLEVRMAAAQALHAQKNTEGLASLLADLPKLLEARPISDEIPLPSFHHVDEVLETLFRLAPAKALARVREVVEPLSPDLKANILGNVPHALGFESAIAPKNPAERPQPPEVWKEAEALVIALVLDESARMGTSIVNGRERPNVVGELAAELALTLWPKRYKYDPKAELDARVAQRYALVNVWRKAQSLPLLTPPGAPAPIEPVDPKAAKALIDAWLAAEPGEARATAEAAIAAQGLRMLAPLKSARKSLKETDARRVPLDVLVRRTANTLREVVWAKEGPKPDIALKAYVDGLIGKPLAGREVTGLWRQFAAHTQEGVHGIELQIVRLGNGTGCVLSLRLTTEVVPWRGGDGGWILTDTGQEHVDADFLADANSWWHKARSEQLDERALLLDETKDVRLRRGFARARG